MISTYSELLDTLGKLVTFEGDNPGDASIGTLQTVIALAEFRIYRDARTGYNQAVFGVSDVTSGNAYTLPAGFKAVSLLHFGKEPLEPVAPEYIQSQLNSGATGDVRHFANIAGTLRFAPTVADGTQLQGTYYRALPALSEATLPSNALFAASNDLFLFAAMVEAAPLYGFMDQLSLWNTKFQTVMEALNQEQQMTAYGSRLKRRASTKLMG